MPLDEDVVESIYREHGPALRRFVLSASRDPQLAEDVVQETVLRVWQHAPEVTGSLRSYLFRTARNIMIDNYRRAQRRPAETLADGLIDPAVAAERVDHADVLPHVPARARLVARRGRGGDADALQVAADDV